MKMENSQQIEGLTVYLELLIILNKQLPNSLDRMENYFYRVNN